MDRPFYKPAPARVSESSGNRCRRVLKFGALAFMAVLLTGAFLATGTLSQGKDFGTGFDPAAGGRVALNGQGLSERKILGLFSSNVKNNLKAKYPSSQWPAVRNLRLFARWVNVQPTRRGQFSWATLDSQVSSALSIGVNSILLTLTGPVPDWARGGSHPYAPPGNMKDWSDFCGAVATRYRGYVDFYQVWQEPGWDIDAPPAERGVVYYASRCDYTYLGMMRSGYGAIKAADPAAVVYSGSLVCGLSHSAADLKDYETLLAGSNQDVSMRVTCGQEIVAERPIYFDYRGEFIGGNVEMGVKTPGKTWYLAEGATHRGFEEWLCIQNPGNADTRVTITYMFPGGAYKEQRATVRAHSRFTVSVNDAVGPGRDVAAKVQSESDVVVERPVYFNYQDKWNGGSISSGVAELSKSWYLAEGATHEGFEEWISLMNPGTSPADVTITYMFRGGGTQVQKVNMAATSRETINVNAAVGPGRDVSAMVVSDQPMIAERPMYFNYGGVCSGGHTQVGSPAPNTEWLFAEGTTRKTAGEGSFEEWLSMMNPGDSDAQVTLTYMFPGGGTQVSHKSVRARSRETVLVNDEVGNDKDVSVQVESTQPMIAERSMYFNYANRITGGSVETGCQEGSRTWYFAEGTTREGFEQWLTLMNPASSPDTATITYMFADGTVQDQKVALAPKSRTTIGVNRSLSIANICDGLAVHPYDYPDFWAWYYRYLVDMCAGQGYPGLEVVVTEIGWPHAHAYSPGFTPEDQRKAIGELGIGSLWNSGCRKIWVFQDVDPEEAWDGVYSGLYYYNGTPTPAWEEYKKWQMQLPDYGNKPKSLFP